MPKQNLQRGQGKPHATPARDNHSAPAFLFPAVLNEDVVTAIAGGRLRLDARVLVLAQAERVIGICRRLAACIAVALDGMDHALAWITG